MIHLYTPKVRLFKRSTIAITSVALLSIFLLQSCYKDIVPDMNDLGWNPSLAAPLVDGELAFSSLIIDSTYGKIATNGDGYLSFYYSTSAKAPFDGGFILSTLTIQPLIESDTQFKVKATDNAAFSSGTAISYNPDTVKFQFTGNEIMQRLEFKSGDFTIQGSSNFLGGTIVTFSIPNLKDANHVSYVRTVTYGATTKDTSLSLAGYGIDLLTVGSTNCLLVNVSVKTATGGQVPRASDKIDFAYMFSNFSFSYAKGNLKFPAFNIAIDSSAIDAFKNAQNADIFIDNPKLTMEFKNSFGLKIPLKFTKLSAQFSDGTYEDVLKAGQPDSFLVNGPPVTSRDVIVQSSMLFDKTNSNLSDIFSKTPKKIFYGFSSNNYGASPLSYIQDTSHLYVNTNFELPLDLAIKNVAFQKAFKADFSKMPNAESASVQINSENGFPIALKLQLYFLDKDSVKIDSLNSTNQDIVGAGTRVNNVNVATKKIIQLGLTREQLVKIKGSATIIKIKASAQTPGVYPQTVKFYADQKMKLKVGFLASKIDLKNK